MLPVSARRSSLLYRLPITIDQCSPDVLPLLYNPGRLGPYLPSPLPIAWLNLQWDYFASPAPPSNIAEISSSVTSFQSRAIVYNSDEQVEVVGRTSDPCTR